MNPTQLSTRSRPLSNEAMEVAALLRDYPDLSPAEIEQLAAGFSRLSLIDAGLLTADDVLGARLDAFLRVHGRKVERPWAHLLLIGPIAALFALVWLAASLGG